MSTSLKQSILEEARRLGFVLAGVTTPEPPPHLSTFEAWLAHGRHATMDYLASPRSRERRADPRQVLPECKSILALATPYSRPQAGEHLQQADRARIAAYAWGDDYHDVLPARLKSLAEYIERQAGRPVANRWYTDTGPVLERDLAQRAGLGWIGKNTCLIHPQHGSYFLLAELFLDLELEPDTPFLATGHCGTCTRCLEACPTGCILPDRTLDAGRCISYLTIERKEGIPEELRPQVGEWVFGCDICQQVCPWNRFAQEEGDPAFRGDPDTRQPELIRELKEMPETYSRKFKRSAVRRARRRGYLRNLSVAAGNAAGAEAVPLLRRLLDDADQTVREHAAWAIERITRRQ